MGFKLTNPYDVMDWWMYLFWKQGISPREFKKNQMRDIKKIMQIKNAINEKEMREAQVRELMNKVKF